MMNHPLHDKAKELGLTYKNSEASLVETLMAMAEENLFIRLRFSGMWEYLLRELHFSESQAGYFHRVAQRARSVPALKEAVVSGRLSVSQARRIVGVIDNENASRWIEAALTLKQKALERKVAEESPRRGVREGFTPVDKDLSRLTVLVTLTEEKSFERARDLVSQSQRKPASYQETLATVTALYLEKKDPVKKAERASSRTSKSRRPSVVLSARRRPIPASVRHAVHLRDGFRCTHTDENHQRCEAQRFLELHHLTSVCRGGADTLPNLTTRCSAHHRMEHLGSS